MPSAFVGSLAGAGTYEQSTHVDRTAATVDAGVELVRAGHYNISVGYQGEFGRNYQRKGAKVKVSIPF